MRKGVALLGMLLLSSSLCFADQPTQVNDGRYVIYQHPTFRGDKYLLDTKTGKTWEFVQTKEGERVWSQLMYDCFKEDKSYSGRYINPR